MKSFFFTFVFLLIGCASTAQVPSTENLSFWSCQHIYSSDRSVSFETDNIQMVQITNCPEVLMNEGKCPSYVKIQSIEDATVWLTVDEWKNYSCRFQEKK